MNEDPDSAHSGDVVEFPAASSRTTDIALDELEIVYAYIYARVGNRADAEDLTAEVFLAAFGPLRLDASPGEVRAYLAAAARTALARHWRGRLGVEVTHIDADHAPAELDVEPTSSPAPGRVEALLGALPERHRRVLELRFLEARSVGEVAREMGISAGNARVLQHRALCMAGRAGNGSPSSGRA